MNIKLVEATPTDVEQLEAKVNEAVEPKGLEGGNEGEIDTIAVRQVLELEDEGDKEKYKDDVQTLIKWAKQIVKGDDPMELKWAIRDLKTRISTPLHEDRIKHLARFAYLDLEEKRIQKEKRSFV